MEEKGADVAEAVCALLLSHALYNFNVKAETGGAREERVHFSSDTSRRWECGGRAGEGEARNRSVSSLIGPCHWFGFYGCIQASRQKASDSSVH